MSVIIFPETGRTDPDGHLLMPARQHDLFRHREVWAVYCFQAARSVADARCSDFVSIQTARKRADDMNRNRPSGQPLYYRVYRLAEQDSENNLTR